MNWNKDIPIDRREVIILPSMQDDATDLANYIAIELEVLETALRLTKAFRNITDSLNIFPQSHELDEDPELKKYGDLDTALISSCT